MNTLSSLFIFIISVAVISAYAQNETSPQIETGQSIEEVSKEYGFMLDNMEFITLASVVVNAVLVFFIYRTYRENKNQFIALHRPWLNIRVGKIDPEGYCEFIIKNHGNLPCQNMNITYKDLETKEPKVDNIYSPIRSLMPSQEQNFFLSIVDTTVDSTSENEPHLNVSFDVEITVEYSYGTNSKKIIFNISENTSASDDGPFIQTKYMD